MDAPGAPVTLPQLLAERCKSLLARHGIDKPVVVQAAQTVEETDFLLNLAAHHDFVVGAVGWLDLDNEDLLSKGGDSPYLRNRYRDSRFKESLVYITKI